MPQLRRLSTSNRDENADEEDEENDNFERSCLSSSSSSESSGCDFEEPEGDFNVSVVVPPPCPTSSSFPSYFPWPPPTIADTSSSDSALASATALWKVDPPLLRSDGSVHTDAPHPSWSKRPSSSFRLRHNHHHDDDRRQRRRQRRQRRRRRFRGRRVASDTDEAQIDERVRRRQEQQSSNASRRQRLCRRIGPYSMACLAVAALIAVSAVRWTERTRHRRNHRSVDEDDEAVAEVSEETEMEEKDKEETRVGEIDIERDWEWEWEEEEEKARTELFNGSGGGTFLRDKEGLDLLFDESEQDIFGEGGDDGADDAGYDGASYGWDEDESGVVELSASPGVLLPAAVGYSSNAALNSSHYAPDIGNVDDNNDEKHDGMRLRAETFVDGDVLPEVYAGSNGISPPLVWDNVPPGTESFVLLFDEISPLVDPPIGREGGEGGGLRRRKRLRRTRGRRTSSYPLSSPNLISHWVAYDIPTRLVRLPAGVPNVHRISVDVLFRDVIQKDGDADWSDSMYVFQGPNSWEGRGEMELEGLIVVDGEISYEKAAIEQAEERESRWSDDDSGDGGIKNNEEDRNEGEEKTLDEEDEIRRSDDHSGDDEGDANKQSRGAGKNEEEKAEVAVTAAAAIVDNVKDEHLVETRERYGGIGVGYHGPALSDEGGVYAGGDGAAAAAGAAAAVETSSLVRRIGRFRLFALAGRTLDGDESNNGRDDDGDHPYVGGGKRYQGAQKERLDPKDASRAEVLTRAAGVGVLGTATLRVLL